MEGVDAIVDDSHIQIFDNRVAFEGVVARKCELGRGLVILGLFFLLLHHALRAVVEMRASTVKIVEAIAIVMLIGRDRGD